MTFVQLLIRIYVAHLIEQKLFNSAVFCTDYIECRWQQNKLTQDIAGVTFTGKRTFHSVILSNKYPRPGL
jgi:hypothetical protein